MNNDIKTSQEWCDEIFFNYKCYAGPSLTKNKLARLPKVVGPGPLSLVLIDVLNKILLVSFKPAKLLKDWEANGPPEEGMQLALLRAKLKKHRNYAYVPIVRQRAQVESFCRAVCIKLSACPCLFGPREYSDTCPHDCQRVAKSTFHNDMKRRGRKKRSITGRRKQKKATGKGVKVQPLENNGTGESIVFESNEGSPSDLGTPLNLPYRITEFKRNAPRKCENEKKCCKMGMKTRGEDKISEQKECKDIYSSERSTKIISDVSDLQEPKLKKIKFTVDDSLPSNNKIFQKDLTLSWFKNHSRLCQNPMDWSVDDVYEYLSKTEECKFIADKMKKEEVDGLAFILLDLPTITHFLHLEKEYARRILKHITIVRWYCDVNFGENGKCDL